MNIIEVLLVVIFLLLGSLGWGELLFNLFGSNNNTTSSDENFPLKLVIGMTIFVAYGGLLCAVKCCYFIPLFSWFIAGQVILLCCTLRSKTHHKELKINQRNVSTTLALAVSFPFFLSNAVFVFSSYNPNDDYPGYIYLTNRLLTSGGMIDSFNLRRMQSYGGNFVYQEVFLKLFGYGSQRIFELVFCSVILFLLVIYPLNKKYQIAGSAFIIFLLIFVQNAGEVNNTSPSLSISVFVLSIFIVLEKLNQNNNSRLNLKYSTTLGLLIGALFVFRWFFIPAIALSILVYFLLMNKKSLFKLTCIFAPISLITVSGWLIAAYESNNTIFYPIWNGNFSSSSPAQSLPVVSSASVYFDKFFQLFTWGGQGYVLLACLISSLVWLQKNKSSDTKPFVLLAATLGSIFHIAFITVTLSGGDLSAMNRYTAPLSFACGLYGLATFWPKLITISENNRSSGAIPSLLIAAALLNVPASLITPIAIELTSLNNLINKSQISLPINSAIPNYRLVNKLIPHGASVLSNVEYPELLNINKFKVNTLDVYGSVSPEPGIPYFENRTKIVEYLRKNRINYILQEMNDAPGIQSSQIFLGTSNSSVFAYRTIIPYASAWFSFINYEINYNKISVQFVSNFALIKIS